MRIQRTGLAVAALSMMLVAGCGGSDSSKSDSKSNAGRPPVSRPGPMAPNGKSGTADQTVPREAAPEGARPADPEPSTAYLSTFALDVDTASYGYARRSLEDGRRPEGSTVRPEEFVNAFRQDYPEPAGNGFSVSADGGRLGPDPVASDPRQFPEDTPGDVRMLRIGLQTRSASAGLRRDAHLTFVIDTSGSMAEPGRLDLVKDSLDTLVDQLRPSDSVAIVAYDEKARLVRPMTPASQRAELHRAIAELRPGASTNLEAGMKLGYKEARRGFREGITNRVILASDGLANTGATSSAPILRQVSDEAGQGVSLLCVGVGSDYGDKLMEELADHGNGRAVYVSDLAKARRIFVEQLPATLELRARDAKAQVGFDPRQVESFRLIGYDDRALKPEDFRDDGVDGGEIGPGHSVTALYAVRLRPGASGHLADIGVRWQDPDTRQPAEAGHTVTVADLSPPLWTEGSVRLRVNVAAAYFAEQLRDGPSRAAQSSYSGTAPSPFITHGRLPGEPFVGLDELSRRVDELDRSAEDKDVTELGTLIHRAQRL